jgi:hypothetical protein
MNAHVAVASSRGRHHGFIVTGSFTPLLLHVASDTDVPPVTEIPCNRCAKHGIFLG